MGIEDRIGEVAAAYLRPGERVQAVVRASRSGPAPWGGSGRLNRAVVVTGQRIIVLAVDGIRPRALEVIAELPRWTRLGPARLPDPYLLNLVADEPLWIPAESFRAVGQADALRPDLPPAARHRARPPAFPQHPPRPSGNPGTEI